MIVQREGYIPVNTRLPCSIVKAIEDLQEHRTNVSTIKPIDHINFRSSRSTSILSLEGISSTPDNECQEHHNHPSSLCSRRSSYVWVIKSVAIDASSEHLSHPIECFVEGSSSCVEACEIDVVVLVGVELVWCRTCLMRRTLGRGIRCIRRF
jgi:hypothetical protein